MTATETWTIGRLLEWTTGFLKSRGADSPRLDAEVLLAHAVGCQRIALYTQFTEVPRDEVRTAFRELVKRRSEGTPVAYLVGHREFFSLDFEVSPAVLIPRPETELLVIELLDRAKRQVPAGGQRLRIVDVGTGSGVIAVCAARRLPEAIITAVDLSDDALALARRNAERHGVEERITWHRGDLLTAVPEDAPIDFVVSNPPYVTSAEWESLSRDVRDYEPRLALEAGERGTEVIERLIPQAAERLAAGGWLMMEISPMLEAEVVALLHNHPRIEPQPVVKDLAGRPRVAVARKR